LVADVRHLEQIGVEPCHPDTVPEEGFMGQGCTGGHHYTIEAQRFHLVGDMPRLIEVNTNAGGSLLAYLAHHPSLPVVPESLEDRHKRRLLKTFSSEILQFTNGYKDKPERIAIVDENPEEQHLYAEMKVFADLFREWGSDAVIVDPGKLQASEKGVWFDDERIDFIYNRHCDFYLESNQMAGLRHAYLNGKVCLSPNPHMYGLLADKRRMPLWSDPQAWQDWSLPAADKQLLQELVPNSTLLNEFDLEDLWSQRKQYVFKPVSSFGSRGVLLGEKISRKRFNQLPLEQTLVQEVVPPSMTETSDFATMKTDFRLYAYRSRVLGVTARLYRGQVTNMRTPGGGFARVKID
jgi:hypothetical protein